MKNIANQTQGMSESFDEYSNESLDELQEIIMGIRVAKSILALEGYTNYLKHECYLYSRNRMRAVKELGEESTRELDEKMVEITTHPELNYIPVNFE